MKFILLAATLISMNVMAETISFKCDFTDLTYLNQFSLEAKSVDFEDGKFHNQGFDFSLRHAGKNPRFERSVVTRDGSVVVREAGTFENHKSIQLTSAVKGAELESINLLVDVSQRHASQIRFLDGKAFLGTCKSL